MNLVLWIGQSLLALVFLGSGAAKSVMTKDRMIATGQTGVRPFPLPAIRIVAALELLGAVGLIAPWASGILPVLTPAAALGFVLLMVGAGISHASLGEYRQVVGVNAVLAVVAGLVAYGRGIQL